jgi:glycosyltransferase involved in cell wall biosynthesis
VLNPLKLIIQIPCYNEEDSLAATLACLPRRIPGIDEIEMLVIDDGSEDRTAEVARAAGAIVHSLGSHHGLATGFSTGVREALARGADIVVNTDADNQYEAADIPALIQPILAGQAGLVLGDREVSTEEYFSPMKRLLQSFGSRVVSLAVGVRVPDATSGFRAFSRTAAARVIVLSKYSYTLETLIQAGALKERIAFVPIRTHAPVRPSRLMRSKFEYVLRSAVIILRSFALYHPVKILMVPTAFSFALAIAGFLNGDFVAVEIAAILQLLGMVGFAALYQRHRAVLHRVQQQLDGVDSSAAASYVTADNV